MRTGMIRKMYIYLLPIIAGAAIIFQSTLNNQFSRENGLLETVIMVHLFGLVVSVLIYVFKGNSITSVLTTTNLKIIISGACGVVITYAIAFSITNIGVLETVTISIVIQMLLSKLVDHFGIFGVEVRSITTTDIIALLLFIAAIITLRINK